MPALDLGEHFVNAVRNDDLAQSLRGYERRKNFLLPDEQAQAAPAGPYDAGLR
jgi:hypothetical protein